MVLRAFGQRDIPNGHCHTRLWFTVKLPRDYARSRRPFWMTSSGRIWLLEINVCQTNFCENMSFFVFGIVLADSLVASGAHTSAGTLVTKFMIHAPSFVVLCFDMLRLKSLLGSPDVFSHILPCCKCMKATLAVKCDMAFIPPMYLNKPNITYLLTQFQWNNLVIYE